MERIGRSSSCIDSRVEGVQFALRTIKFWLNLNCVVRFEIQPISEEIGLGCRVLMSRLGTCIEPQHLALHRFKIFIIPIGTDCVIVLRTLSLRRSFQLLWRWSCCTTTPLLTRYMLKVIMPLCFWQFNLYRLALQLRPLGKVKTDRRRMHPSVHLSNCVDLHRSTCTLQTAAIHKLQKHLDMAFVYVIKDFIGCSEVICHPFWPMMRFWGSNPQP